MTSRVLRSSLAASQKSKARVEASLNTLCEAAAQKHDEAETALAALRAACTEDEQEATQAAAAAARARLDAARTEIRASKDAASLAAAASTVEQLGDDGKAVATELSGALITTLKSWLEGAEAEALCAGARELSLAPPGGLAVDNLARERAAHAALQQLLALGARVDALREGTRTECAALLQARATRWCDGQLAAVGRLAGQQSTLGAAALSEAVATASAACRGAAALYALSGLAPELAPEPPPDAVLALVATLAAAESAAAAELLGKLDAATIVGAALGPSGRRALSKLAAGVERLGGGS